MAKFLHWPFSALVLIAVMGPAFAGGPPTYTVRDLHVSGNPFSFGAQGSVTLTGTGSAVTSNGDVFTTALNKDGEFPIIRISPDGSKTTLPGSVTGRVVQVIGANEDGEVLTYNEEHQNHPGPNGNGADFLFYKEQYFAAGDLVPASSGYHLEQLSSINNAHQITAVARTTKGNYTLVLLTESVAPAASFQVVTPTEGSVYNTSQTVDFLVNATDTVPYYVTWQVDNGQENRMAQNANGSWFATVSFAGWTWTGPLGGSRHDVGFKKRATSDGSIIKSADQAVTVNH